MRWLLGTVVVVFAVLTALVIVPDNSSRELTANEVFVRNLVREVHGENIVSEKLTFKRDDAVLIVGLQTGKYAELQINLSSLAEKHRHGDVSVSALKRTLQLGSGA